MVEIDDDWSYWPDFRKRKTQRVNAQCWRSIPGVMIEKEFSLSLLKYGDMIKIDDFINHDLQSILKVRGNVIWLPEGKRLGIISNREDENLPKDKNTPKTKSKGELSIEELDTVEFEKASEIQKDYFSSRITFIKRVLEEYRGYISIKCMLV